MKIKNNCVSNDAVINMVNNHARLVELRERQSSVQARMKKPVSRIRICITGKDLIDCVKLICMAAVLYGIFYVGAVCGW